MGLAQQRGRGHFYGSVAAHGRSDGGSYGVAVRDEGGGTGGVEHFQQAEGLSLIHI